MAFPPLAGQPQFCGGPGDLSYRDFTKKARLLVSSHQAMPLVPALLHLTSAVLYATGEWEELYMHLIFSFIERMCFWEEETVGISSLPK